MRKNRKKGGRYGSAGWVGGLVVAGGEVRRGKPSQTGDLTDSLEPRQHPVGVRRIEDASARPPHPKMAGPADGVPRASSEFMHDFWRSPPAFSSMP